MTNYSDTITVQPNGRDEQRVSVYTYADHSVSDLINVEVDDDEDGSVIELNLTTTEVEALIAKLSTALAFHRMTA